MTISATCRHDWDWLNGRCYFQNCKKCGAQREKWQDFSDMVRWPN